MIPQNRLGRGNHTTGRVGHAGNMGKKTERVDERGGNDFHLSKISLGWNKPQVVLFLVGLLSSDACRSGKVIHGGLFGDLCGCCPSFIFW